MGMSGRLAAFTGPTCVLGRRSGWRRGVSAPFSKPRGTSLFFFSWLKIRRCTQSRPRIGLPQLDARTSPPPEFCSPSALSILNSRLMSHCTRGGRQTDSCMKRGLASTPLGHIFPLWKITYHPGGGMTLSGEKRKDGCGGCTCTSIMAAMGNGDEVIDFDLEQGVSARVLSPV